MQRQHERKHQIMQRQHERKQKGKNRTNKSVIIGFVVISVIIIPDKFTINRSIGLLNTKAVKIIKEPKIERPNNH